MRDWTSFVPLILALMIFCLGYVSGRNVTRQARPPTRPGEHDERETVVRRTRPNMRDPLRPTKHSYEAFRTKDGLFAPVKPTGGRADEIDLKRGE